MAIKSYGAPLCRQNTKSLAIHILFKIFAPRHILRCSAKQASETISRASTLIIQQKTVVCKNFFQHVKIQYIQAIGHIFYEISLESHTLCRITVH